MRLNSHEFDQYETTFNYQFQKILLAVFNMYPSKSLSYLSTTSYSSQNTNPTFQGEGLIYQSLYCPGHLRSIFYSILFLTCASKSGRLSHASILASHSVFPRPGQYYYSLTDRHVNPLPYLTVSKMTSAHA